ncbi:Rhamnan synthesis F, partial [methanotrophic bacterial endosymbiont of Bathymodiolus sp.]
LYININNKSNDDFFFQILDEYPSATLFSYENRGRDILPFIQMLKYIIPLDYKYVCKIHTKKSTHRQDGDIWRKHLVASILSSVKRIEQAKELIDNGAGIVIAKGNIFSYEEWKGSNEHMINELVKKLNIKLDSNFLFPAGSIFWFSPYVFRKITDLIDVSEFEFEEGQVDGTIAHAVERIFGLMCFIEKKILKKFSGYMIK